MEDNRTEECRSEKTERAEESMPEKSGTGILSGGLLAAVLSVPAAYYYVDQVLLKIYAPGGPRGRIQMLVFTLIWAVAVETWARAQERGLQERDLKERGLLTQGRGLTEDGRITPQSGIVPAESRFWFLCLLAEGIGFALQGVQGGSRGAWQLILWHVTAVLYALARTGQLTEGRSSIFIIRDLLRGFVVLPWSNYLLRIRTVIRGIAEAVSRKKGTEEPGAVAADEGAENTNGSEEQDNKAAVVTGRGRKASSRLSVILLSTAAAVVIGLYAWGQLAAASSSFARLGEWLLSPADRLLRYLYQEWDAILESFGEKIAILVLSLPVGAWLYGLVGGALRAEDQGDAGEQIRASLEKKRRIPALTLYLVCGILTAVYMLFFCVQAAEVLARTMPGGGRSLITPFSAMTFAVSGFWELCRILLLNLAVLGVGVFFCRESPLERGPMRTAGGALILCSLALALLNAAKLALYIRLCGFTPRRIVAGWVLMVIVCCVWLAGIRLFREFNAAGMAIRLTAVSFALLCCMGIEQFCIRDDLARYTAGIETAPDTALLQECRFDARGEVIEYTQILLDAGWFEGRDSYEVYQLYSEILDREKGWSYWPEGGDGDLWEIPLRRAEDELKVLKIYWEGNVCIGAEWK